MLTIYTCRDVRQGEELTFAYFGSNEDESEEKEEEMEVDEHSQKKDKVVCSFPDDSDRRRTALTPFIRLVELQAIKTKQSIDLACAGLPTVAAKCSKFNFSWFTTILHYIICFICYRPTFVFFLIYQ